MTIMKDRQVDIVSDSPDVTNVQSVARSQHGYSRRITCIARLDDNVRCLVQRCLAFANGNQQKDNIRNPSIFWIHQQRFIRELSLLQAKDFRLWIPLTAIDNDTMKPAQGRFVGDKRHGKKAHDRRVHTKCFRCLPTSFSFLPTRNSPVAERSEPAGLVRLTFISWFK